MRAFLERVIAERRRFAPLVLVIGGIVIGTTLARQAPVTQRLTLRVPAASSVTSVRVAYFHDGEPVRERTLRYAHGAPETIRDACELSPGRYAVTIDVVRGERGTTQTRNIDVEQASTLVVDLEPGS